MNKRDIKQEERPLCPQCKQPLSWVMKKEYVYPYRKESGYRSILEAVDIRDARKHLSTWPGTVFCKVPMPRNFPSILCSKDLDETVDTYLRNNNVYFV